MIEEIDKQSTANELDAIRDESMELNSDEESENKLLESMTDSGVDVIVKVKSVYFFGNSSNVDP